MPLQYIKTLGGLVINDGNPNNDVNLTTGAGGTGKVRINGNDGSGGGGGGGGDVYLDGADGNPGQAYPKSLDFNTFPIKNSSNGDAFLATGANANIQSYDTIQANDPNVAGSLSEMKADGTATFTGLVKVGDAGGAGNGLECNMDVQCAQSIRFTPVGGSDSLLLDKSSQSITARNITAYRAVLGQDGQVTAHTLKATGGNNDPAKVEVDDDGEIVTGTVTIGNSSFYLNKVSLERRNTDPNDPIADRKTDLVFNMPSSNYVAPNATAEGAAEIFFENNVPLAGNVTNPAYQRLCKIEELGFTSCKPIRYFALHDITSADAGEASYAYSAEVYDVFTNAGAVGVPAAATLDFTTRICNDLTNDGQGHLADYLLFSMSSSAAAKGSAALGDAGFQSKYPAANGEASDVITWNVGHVAGDAGVNNFQPGKEAFKRKHWRIGFKQKDDVKATNAVGTIAVGDTVLEGFEGYIDVCIGEFPTGAAAIEPYQYKQVCYGTKINLLQTNLAPTGTRTADRGQARMARRNQYAGNPALGVFQFFMDFPSWDLTSIGGTNNAAVSMTLNFTFTCLQ